MRLAAGRLALVAGVYAGTSACAISDTYLAEDVERAQGPVPLDVVASLILLGDGGDTLGTDGGRVLDMLRDEAVRGRSETTLVVFLGDNVYPSGLRRDDGGDFLPRDAERFEAQLEAVAASGLNAIFVPGDRDHDAGGPDAIRNQAELALNYARRFGRERDRDAVRFLPRAGDPGPDVLDWGDTFRLVALDTEAWIADPTDLRFPVGGGEVARRTRLGRLERTIRDAGDLLVVVLGHHPIVSHGPRGGFHPWETHIFPLRDAASWAWLPLPIFGSMYVGIRGMGISDIDLANARYSAFATDLAACFERARPAIYASGHENSIQVLRAPDGLLQVVSGAASPPRVTAVGTDDDTVMASPFPGLLRIDALGDGRLRAEIVEVVDVGQVRRTAVWL